MISVQYTLFNIKLVSQRCLNDINKAPIWYRFYIKMKLFFNPLLIPVAKSKNHDPWRFNSGYPSGSVFPVNAVF